MRVVRAFVSADEEEQLLSEVNKHFRGKKYDYGHWDGYIRGYRETEKSRWSENNRLVFERLRQEAFGDVDILPRVHVLDLAADGHIDPHIDSVKFCGSTIAGISLLSDSVMRLEGSEGRCDVLLERGSLYVMTGKARYDFTHAILKDDESFFDGRHVARERRVSLICRLPPLFQPGAVSPSSQGVSPTEGTK